MGWEEARILRKSESIAISGIDDPEAFSHFLMPERKTVGIERWEKALTSLHIKGKTTIIVSGGLGSSHIHIRFLNHQMHGNRESYGRSQ